MASYGLRCAGSSIPSSSSISNPTHNQSRKSDPVESLVVFSTLGELSVFEMDPAKWLDKLSGMLRV